MKSLKDKRFMYRNGILEYLKDIKNADIEYHFSKSGLFNHDDVKESIKEFEKYINMLNKEDRDELLIYYEEIFGDWEE